MQKEGRTKQARGSDHRLHPQILILGMRLQGFPSMAEMDQVLLYP
jgi:hypothetical protein